MSAGRAWSEDRSGGPRRWSAPRRWSSTVTTGATTAATIGATGAGDGSDGPGAGVARFPEPAGSCRGVRHDPAAAPAGRDRARRSARIRRVRLRSGGVPGDGRAESLHGPRGLLRHRGEPHSPLGSVERHVILRLPRLPAAPARRGADTFRTHRGVRACHPVTRCHRLERLKKAAPCDLRGRSPG